MKRFTLKLAVLISFYFFLSVGQVALAGPVSTVTKEELALLSNQSVPEAFEKLKDPAIFVNPDLLDSGIKSAFSGRESDAVGYAMNVLRTPRIQFIDGRKVNRSADFRVAKKIFQQFAAQAIVLLEDEYNHGAPIIRCNIIQMIGAMDKEKKAREMLVVALNDAATCEEEDPQSEGLPLRVCDAAYNQLVLRYHLKDVLRGIGSSHKVEDRNYHINILKDKIKNQK